MKLTFERSRWTMDDQGFWLCLNVKESAQARQFVETKKERPYTAELKEYRQSRSLNANAYMWALCEQLSERLGIDKEDIYRRAVKESGLSRDLELDNDAASTMQRAWERQGIAWFSEKVDDVTQTRSLIRFYYGSSCYNSRQMARLIDNLVQECQAQDIDTLTPSERALLCDQWEAET